MRKVIIALAICMVLAGCASMTYIAPDGTQVRYQRFCTGSDSIKAALPSGAGIETQGQKSFDPATLQAIFDILGKVK